jgi:hypothetical protein
MAHYRNAQPSPAARDANAALPGYIVGASDWLRSIRDDRAAFVDRSALLLRGLKDIAFRKKELERWKSVLTDFELHEFEDCGHFLAEEAPDRVVSTLRAFLGSTWNRLLLSSGVRVTHLALSVITDNLLPDHGVRSHNAHARSWGPGTAVPVTAGVYDVPIRDSTQRI